MEEKKKSTKKSEVLPIVDLLKGRIPNFESNTRFYVVLFVVVGFWMFVISMLGRWIFSIPRVWNFWELFSKINN